MAECHPVGFQWVMEAKARGAKVIHVDPRFTRTSAVSDLHVPIRAGSDIAFLGALVNHVLTGEHDFREYVLAYTNASTIVSEDFRDTEDLDGLFSGWDAEEGQYDTSSWQYEGTEIAASAGKRDQPRLPGREWLSFRPESAVAARRTPSTAQLRRWPGTPKYGARASDGAWSRAYASACWCGTLDTDGLRRALLAWRRAAALPERCSLAKLAGCNGSGQTEVVADGASKKTSRSEAKRAHVGHAELEAVQAACRVLVAISSQSIAAVEDQVDLTQFRALVILASRGSVSLGELADAAKLHLSTASRMCDRMVVAGLMNRADDPANRRQLMLTLTDGGRRVVEDVMRQRRAALEPMLAAMPKPRRAELVTLLQEFAASAPPPAEPDLWFMGWST